MATEKTSLLNNNLIKNKAKESIVMIVTIPKQITNTDEDAWSGLTRDELMQYVHDPFWVSLRKVFMIIFWLTIVAMFTSALIIASVEHNEVCTLKLKIMNLKAIPMPVEMLITKLSISSDKSNLTNSLAS